MFDKAVLLRFICSALVETAVSPLYHGDSPGSFEDVKIVCPAVQKLGVSVTCSDSRQDVLKTQGIVPASRENHPAIAFRLVPSLAPLKPSN